MKFETFWKGDIIDNAVFKPDNKTFVLNPARDPGIESGKICSEGF